MSLSLPSSPQRSLDEVVATLKRAQGLEGSLTPLSGERAGERDCRLLAEPADGSRWVLKIAASEEDSGHLDLQVRALRHLQVTAADLL